MRATFETMTCADGSSHLHRYIFGIINYIGIDINVALTNMIRTIPILSHSPPTPTACSYILCLLLTICRASSTPSLSAVSHPLTTTAAPTLCSCTCVLQCPVLYNCTLSTSACAIVFRVRTYNSKSVQPYESVCIISIKPFVQFK